jgi:membrane-bound serine protease (ClpP class)
MHSSRVRHRPSLARRRAASLILSLIVLTLLLVLLAALAPLLAQPRPTGEVFHARLSSIIHPVAAQFLHDTLAKADAAGATAVVVELNTPGGLSTSTREITEAILAARSPVVVYVAPGGAQAASAGFFVLLSADIAAMAPGTETGAAHPVGPQGADIQGVLGQKVEKDAAATIRALAARAGRDVAVAEEAVLHSRSFTAQEALQAKLIDLVSPSLQDLLRSIDGRQVRKGTVTLTLHTRSAALREVDMSASQRLLSALAHPDIAYLLLTLGGLGLVFELMHPGAVLPGVVGGIALILAFFALSVLDVNYAGLALILLALVLFVAEVKVASHGLLTLSGVVSLVLGSLMLFQSPEPALRVSLQWIASLALFALAVMGFLTTMAVRARRLPVRTGVEGLVRERGVARSGLAPTGKVFVHGELWEAEAEEPVEPGEPVEVVGVHDMILAVRPLRRG